MSSYTNATSGPNQESPDVPAVRNALSGAWAWCVRLVYEHTALVLAIIFFVTMAGALWHLSQTGWADEVLRLSRQQWFAGGALYLNSSIDQNDQSYQTAASTGHIEVIDGDTVRRDGEKFRLVGFNTPESGLNARCSGEQGLAAKATDRLQQLLSEGAPKLQRVSCACEPGTEGTRRCNHGRLCGKLTVDGRDVGSILIAEGLAERFECWSTSCPRRKDRCRS